MASTLLRSHFYTIFIHEPTEIPDEPKILTRRRVFQMLHVATVLPPYFEQRVGDLT